MKKLLIVIAALFTSLTAFAQSSDIQFFGAQENCIIRIQNHDDLEEDDDFCFGIQNYNLINSYFGFAEKVSWGYEDSFEISAGPAFCFPISEKIKLQSFFGFHYFKNSFSDYNSEYKECISDSDFTNKSLGITWDFQIKPQSHRFCSPVFGITTSFDFVSFGNYKTTKRTWDETAEDYINPVTEKYNIKSPIINIAPYAAFCMNF